MNHWSAVFALLSVVSIGCSRSETPAGSDTTVPSTAAGSVSIGPTRSTLSDCGSHTIREQGVGKVQIGDPVDSLGKCTIVRDTVVPADEGTRARKVLIAFGADTIAAEIVDGRVWRIEVLSPGLRTVDSIGVGTPLTRLFRLRNPRGITGEGRFFVISPDHCGLSFQLRLVPVHGGDLDSATLSRFSGAAPVSRILIIGCRVAGSQ